jgi:hypothetical protein
MPKLAAKAVIKRAALQRAASMSLTAQDAARK